MRHALFDQKYKPPALIVTVWHANIKFSFPRRLGFLLQSFAEFDERLQRIDLPLQ